MAEDVDDFLAHYGILGMKWGHHKESIPGVSARTSREANKDATEYAKAKMYFGEGAGTRRKLINATVNAKAAKDPSYKKAFDHHLNNQDMAKRASQARGERKRTDTKNTVKKTAKGVGHIIKGNSQYASIAATTLVAGAITMHKTGVDRMLLKKGGRAVNTIINHPSVRIAKDFMSNWR
jgi:hypothetical protein